MLLFPLVHNQNYPSKYMGLGYSQPVCIGWNSDPNVSYPMDKNIVFYILTLKETLLWFSSSWKYSTSSAPTSVVHTNKVTDWLKEGTTKPLGSPTTLYITCYGKYLPDFYWCCYTVITSSTKLNPSFSAPEAVGLCRAFARCVHCTYQSNTCLTTGWDK